MSDIDSELTMLRQRIAILEIRKEEIEKISPIDSLSAMVETSKKYLKNSVANKNNQVARFENRKQVATLEPIVDILKDILCRLELLEQK